MVTGWVDMTLAFRRAGITARKPDGELAPSRQVFGGMGEMLKAPRASEVIDFIERADRGEKTRELTDSRGVGRQFISNPQEELGRQQRQMRVVAVGRVSSKHAGDWRT